jgi:histidine ammonia-lyase
VGASGDLALLAHLALTMIGKGEAYYQGMLMSSSEALLKVGLQPMSLQPKEGIAIINGTQGMSALACLLIARAEESAKLADIIGAMTLEAVRGTNRAFLPEVHRQRPHPGQQASAHNLMKLTHDSRIMASHKDCMHIQDCYSLRCMPQVHGATRDAISYARRVLEIEINSTTDNPLVLPDEEDIISAGHFHGQPVALAMDFLAVALAELGSISERRIERLVNPHYSKGLPPFLTPDPGIHSGYMIAQYTAASLASENKGLAHPASVDSIPTSAGQEDHVSMGTTAARKAWRIQENLSYILAVECLCASQGLDFSKLPGSGGVEAARKALRALVPSLKEDRVVTKDIEKARQILMDGTLIRAVEEKTGPLE